MEEFCLLILVGLFATNLLEKAESVQLDELEEMQLQAFDELFVDEWLDKGEAEDLKRPPTNFGQNVHHQIDRQNTQIGQIELNSTDQLGQIDPNSTDQLGQIEPNSTDPLGHIEPNSTDQLGQIEPDSTDQNPPLAESDHSRQIQPNSTNQNAPLKESDNSGQIEPNSTDQNPPLAESDHSGQIEPDSTDQNPPLAESDQSGQIEPNSTDQNPPLTESDHSGQIEPNSIDHNSPLSESDHSDNAKNSEEQNEIMKNAADERRRKIIVRFHAIKDKFKHKGKYSKKEWNQIEEKIGKHLKVSRSKIYEWKKEFGLIQKMHDFGKKKNEQKNLLEKFDQMKAELKRDGFKNSQNKLDKTVAKELGLGFVTIYNWKRELGQSTTKHKHAHSEQKELMKRYYEIKDQNPKNSDKDIAKMLKIGSRTLIRWKRQFKRQQFHAHSVDGHSVEENEISS